MKGVKNEDGKITGFLGVADQNLEMLFIHPDYRGKQIGKTLLNYLIEKMNVKKVGLNEQNEQAAGFYKKVCFKQKVVRNWIHRENHIPLYI